MKGNCIFCLGLVPTKLRAVQLDILILFQTGAHNNEEKEHKNLIMTMFGISSTEKVAAESAGREMMAPEEVPCSPIWMSQPRWCE